MCDLKGKIMRNKISIFSMFVNFAFLKLLKKVRSRILRMLDIARCYRTNVVDFDY